MAIGDYNKAITGALTGLLGSLLVATASGGITHHEWVWVVASTLASGGFILSVPNSGTYAWIEQQYRSNAALIAQAKLRKEK